MSDEKGQDRAARIGLSRPSGGGRLELKKPVETGMVRQSFSHGRSKAVAVEVKKTRAPVAPTRNFATPSTHAPAAPAGDARPAAPPPRPAVPRARASTADRGQDRAGPGTGTRAGARTRAGCGRPGGRGADRAGFASGCHRACGRTGSAAAARPEHDRAAPATTWPQHDGAPPAAGPEHDCPPATALDRAVASRVACRRTGAAWPRAARRPC